VSLLGALGAGILGFKWKSDYDTAKPQLEATMALAKALPTEKQAELNAELAKLDRVVYAAYLLMAGAVLGVIGGIVAMRGLGIVAGVLLLLAVLPAAILVPKSLVFSFPLLVAALLAFVVRRPAVPSPTFKSPR
jgi:hypothetical protein